MARQGRKPTKALTSRTNDALLTVRVSKSMLAALRRDARDAHRTVSDQVRLILHVRFAANLNPDRLLAMLETADNPPPREPEAGLHRAEGE